MIRPCARLRKRVQSNHHEPRGDRCSRECLCGCLSNARRSCVSCYIFNAIFLSHISCDSLRIGFFFFFHFISRPFCILNFNLFEEYVYETCDRKQLHIWQTENEINFYSNFLERNFFFFFFFQFVFNQRLGFVLPSSVIFRNIVSQNLFHFN